MRESKVLLIAGLILLLFVLDCRKKEEWERNPNLALLLKEEGKNLFNPVWSPDGGGIYYLKARSLGSAVSCSGGGSLWIINVNGLDNKLVLDGRFCALAISPNGSKLALSYEVSWPAPAYPTGGPLIIIDTAVSFCDTLPTNLPRVLDVEFNSTGDKVFYYAYSLDVNQSDSFGFYCINIDGTNEELVKKEKDYRLLSFTGFDLDKNDSIFYKRGHPQFNPIKRDYLVYTEGDFFAPLRGPLLLKILNIITNEEIEPDADPYSPPYDNIGGFQSAYWSPDGNKLVISVGKELCNDIPTVTTLELWILNKVW